MGTTRRTQAGKPAARRLSGPRSKYRNKVRAPVSVLLTEAGHQALQKQLLRTQLSRSDLFETLLLNFGDRVKKLDADDLSATG